MDKLLDIRRHNVLVVDLETAYSHESFAAMKSEFPDLAEEFKKKFSDEIDAIEGKYEENWKAGEVYKEVAALYPEYGKIISASFTTIKFKNGKYQNATRSFYDHDEAELLTKINTVLSNDGWILAGMNIDAFDIPFLLKRMMHHGIKPSQSLLQNVFAKPWEKNIIDLANIWAFGGFGAGSKSVKLGAICSILGIDTPKDGVYGHLVPSFYWTGVCEEVYPDSSMTQDEALKVIDEYCQKDTISTAQALMKLNDIIFG